MIKKIILTCLTIACTSSAFAGLTRIEQAILQKIKTNNANIPTPTSISTTEINGLFEVFAGGEIFYTDETAKIFIFGGNMIQMEEQRNLTQESKDKLLHVDVNSINESHGIIEKRGDGSGKLFVFSDPFCPYCQKIEEELAKLDNVTIITLMLPRPEARATAESIWCADDKYELWTKWMIKKQQPTAKSCANPIDDIKKFADQNNIYSTPTLVSRDGRRITGLASVGTITKFITTGAK